ncbi:MAG: hypothetical protein RL754_593 [Bacteroidota bacterium]|jgi:hydrogenase/urease accessory protein HupE
MFYLELGIRHITDWAGYDHMLFLLALTLPLTFADWKATLRWVTAFTIGHSASLAFSALVYHEVPSQWVELGIAVTIALTAVLHALNGFKVMKNGALMALLFGLIHGLGFGSYYNFIAQNDTFLWAWIPFNLGIELGQLIIVVVLLFVYWAVQKLGMKALAYRWLAAGIILTLSGQMILERLP